VGDVREVDVGVLRVRDEVVARSEVRVEAATRSEAGIEDDDVL
jgi:hypothetical protein